jgi:hypothetical protein
MGLVTRLGPALTRTGISVRITSALNGTDMYKNVLAAVIRLNEAEPLGRASVAGVSSRHDRRGRLEQPMLFDVLICLRLAWKALIRSQHIPWRRRGRFLA